MVSVFNKQRLVLLNFKVVLEHDRVLALDIGIHGRVIVAGVLRAIQATMLLSQLLKLLLNFFLPLQCLSLRFFLLLNKRLLLFQFLHLLFLLLLSLFLLLFLSLLFHCRATALHLLCHQLKLLRVDKRSKCGRLITVL